MITKGILTQDRSRLARILVEESDASGLYPSRGHRRDHGFYSEDSFSRLEIVFLFC
jgi:hypothetical protein